MIFSFSRKVILPIFLIGITLSLDVSAITLTKEATWYSDSFDGGQTANGDIFDQKSYSAAICDMPLGQYLYVSKGGKGIVVDANDRPNCARYPGVIDLSREAFRILGSLEAGRIKDTQVTPLGSSPTASLKGFLPRNSFEHLGVLLTGDVPTVLFAGEGITIEGSTTEISDYVIVYIAREGGGFSKSRLVKVARNNMFKAHITTPKMTGEYTLVVARGKSFNTDKYASISLIDESSLSYPSLPIARYKIIPKVNIADSISNITLPENTTGEITIRQGENTFQTKGKTLIFSDTGLRSGVAQIQIGGYTLSTPSPLDRSSRVLSFFSGTVILDSIREGVGQDKLTIRTQKNIANIRFTVPNDANLRPRYYITLPDGSVEEKVFSSEYISREGFLIPGSLIQVQIPLKTKGTYIFEVVREDGIAYINVPIISGTVWPILSSLSENEIRIIRKNKDTVTKETQKKINTLRESLKIPTLSLDTKLTKLAQAKVDDMIARGYQAHEDPDGLYIDGLAKKLGLYSDTSLAENIGYGNISDLALQRGLEESGSHRYTMLSREFSKVGIGYGIKGDKVYLVHVFGE